MKNLLDYYSLRARLIPSLISTLPIIFFVFFIFPSKIIWLNLIWGLFLWCGLSFPIVNIVRSKGQKLEKKLFRYWGGMPSNLMLSHTKTILNKNLLLRYHNLLSKLLPEIKIPSEEEEKENFKNSYDIYDTCIAYLRDKTRDTEKYQLLFSENINYGFKRNLLSLKNISIFTLIFLQSLSFYLYYANHDNIFSELYLFYTGLNSILLLAWIFVVNKKWVKESAMDYSKQLLATLNTLE